LSIQQQQLINLFLLLLLGSFFSNVYLSWWEMGVLLSFTLVFEWFLSAKANFMVVNRTIPSASLSTAIGVMLMMVGTHFYIYFVVIALALVQKHYLQINKQHFFNPSNFALIMALLLFYDHAHIVLGQLGDEIWLSMLLLFMGVFILVRANRWLISLSFTLFYLLFQYVFVVSLDPVLVMEEIYHRFYSISFILFILFMLTDPRTTPSNNVLQVLFAFCVAVVSVLFDHVYGFRVQHLFLSLFLFSLFTPLVEHWQTKDRKLLFKVTFFLFILATVVIMFIENQTPYYFTMES
jgi:hypothetical protein